MVEAGAADVLVVEAEEPLGLDDEQALSTVAGPSITTASNNSLRMLGLLSVIVGSTICRAELGGAQLVIGTVKVSPRSRDGRWFRFLK